MAGHQRRRRRRYLRSSGRPPWVPAIVSAAGCRRQRAGRDDSHGGALAEQAAAHSRLDTMRGTEGRTPAEHAPGFLIARFGVVFRDIEHARGIALQGQQGGVCGSSDMDRAGPLRLGRPGAGTVQLAVAQHGSLQSGRLQHLGFQRDHTADADAAQAFSIDVQRVLFQIRFVAGRISPGDALGDQARGAGGAATRLRVPSLRTRALPAAACVSACGSGTRGRSVN